MSKQSENSLSPIVKTRLDMHPNVQIRLKFDGNIPPSLMQGREFILPYNTILAYEKLT